MPAGPDESDWFSAILAEFDVADCDEVDLSVPETEFRADLRNSPFDPTVPPSVPGLHGAACPRPARSDPEDRG